MPLAPRDKPLALEASAPIFATPCGGMAEWLKAHAWKACIRATVSWVRIPLPPPHTAQDCPASSSLAKSIQIDGSCLSSIHRRVLLMVPMRCMAGWVGGWAAMTKRVNRLSAVTVAKSKGAGMYADGGGLYLQVSNSGSKSWVFRFRFQGRRRDMGLGALPSVGLVAARDKAFECRRLLMQGVDPIEARGAERRSTQARDVTFRQAFETFFELKRKSLSNAKHLKQWPATMSAYVFPSMGDRPVAEVQTGEILDVLTPVWFEKPETGRRLLQRIDAVFKSAILRGHRERASPCIGVVQELGNRHRTVVNHRSLPYQEVPDFLAELRNSKCLPATRLAFEWLILTATRSGETRLANWREIDERSGLWTLSPERTKARRRHVVPLSPRCLEILSEARAHYLQVVAHFSGQQARRSTFRHDAHEGPARHGSSSPSHSTWLSKQLQELVRGGRACSR